MKESLVDVLSKQLQGKPPKLFKEFYFFYFLDKHQVNKVPRSKHTRYFKKHDVFLFSMQTSEN